MKPILVAIALVVAGLPVSIPDSWSPAEQTAARAITANTLRAHVRFLSDDLLEGRAPATRGSELAMRYVASEFERLGLRPAGDGGGYYQRFPLVGLTGTVMAPPVFKAPSSNKAPLSFLAGQDMVIVPGAQAESAAIRDAELVFVGYGIDAPEQRWNDFKGSDVRGKVLVVMNNDPEGDPDLFAGKTRLYYGRWDYKYEEAAKKGAAGVIIIHTTPSAGYPWQVVQTSWGGEAFELPAGNEPRLALKMWATEDASRKIAALGGFDLDELRRRAEGRDFRAVPLGVKLSVEVKTKLRRMDTANVLGILPGGDPALSKELVVYSAHHDHLGIREAKNGDAIYNGALDNASGVAAMLSIAEGLARVSPAPRRSILFAAVAAEESGLLGSQYLCAHPPVPPGRIAADLNVDGINIWGRTRDIDFVGLGKSTLDEAVGSAAKEQGRAVSPDQFPDRGRFYRSDQFNFAKIGVPAAYLKSGLDYVSHDRKWGRERIEEFEKTRYHQPSDQMDGTWDLDGAIDDVRLLAVVGLRVAGAEKMPAWRAGDEFEAARKRAVQAEGKGK